MKETTKRFLSLMLASAMVLSQMSVTAFAEDVLIIEDNVGIGSGTTGENGSSQASDIDGTVVETDSAASGEDSSLQILSVEETADPELVSETGDETGGNTSATELEAADYGALIAALENDAEVLSIKLTGSVVVEAAVEIPKTKTVTLDLNGKTITVTDKMAEEGKHIYAIDNKGTLTLKDSGGTGSVTARGIYNNGKMTVESGTYIAQDTNGGAAVFNYGDLTVNGGTFKGYVGLNNQPDATLVINNAVVTDNTHYSVKNNGGTMTINDANVQGTFGAVGSFSGNTVIYDGTYTMTGLKGKSSHVVYVGGGSVTIYNGTFERVGTVAVGSGSAVTVTAGQATIYGGRFTSFFDNTNAVELWGTASETTGITVQGGTYLTPSEAAADVSKYVADGYELNEDGTVTAEAPDYVPVETYEKLVEALAEKKDVMLTADITATGSISVESAALTIDLNNHKLTLKAGQNYFNANANVTVSNGTIDISGVTATGDCIIGIGDYSTDAALTLNNVNVIGDGYSSAYAVFYVYNTSTFNMNGGSIAVSKDNAEAGGVIKAEQGADGKVNITGTSEDPVELTFTDAKIGFLDGTVSLNYVDLDIKGGANAINQSALTVVDSTLDIHDCNGRALTVKDGNVSIQSSVLNFSGATEGEIRFKAGMKMYLDESSSLAECDIYADDAAAGANVNGFEITGTESKMSTVAAKNGNVVVENPWNGTTINSVEDLIAFAEAVNGGDTFAGKTVTLNTDLDLKDREWTPIGYKGASFQGTFDGGSHTISNLTITKGLENTAANNGIGLFGRTDSPAVIRNLTIDNVDITGSLYVGAVAGYAYTGSSIENVTVRGNIAIDAWWYAGVIGGNGYLNTVNNCYVIGNDGSYIKGNGGSYIGGIWGFRGEGGQKITNCSVTNLAIQGADRVGGICGIGHYGNEISGCSLEAVTVYATDPEATTVGLIVGACQGTESAPTVFENNNVTNNVTASAGETEVTALYGTNISGEIPVTNFVAEINGTLYTSLQTAVESVNSGETITILRNFTIIEGAKGSENAVSDESGKSYTIDLNGYTVSADTGNAVLRFKNTVSNAATVNLKNGVISSGKNTWCAVIASNAEGAGRITLNMTNLTLENNKGGAFAVKLFAGTTANITDCVVNSNYGGGIQAAGGNAVLNNVTVNQQGLWTAPYNSMAVAVSDGGSMTVNSGTYTTQPLAASDGNNQGATHGSWTAGVMNTGGTLIINGGTFSNGNYGEDSGATNARALFTIGETGEGAEAVLEINGGIFNSIGEIFFTETATVDVDVYGGIFNRPVPEEYCGDSYVPTENGDGTYGVKVANEVVLKSGSKRVMYPTLKAALAKAKDGDEITLLGNVTVAEVLNVNKNITINGDGFSITGSAKKVFEVYANAEFEDITINNIYTDKEGRCIDTRVGGIELTLDNVILNANSNGYNQQVINIGGDASSTGAITVNITDSTINASASGYAITTFNPVNMSIDNSGLNGYAALYFKGVSSSAGSAGSVVNVISSELNGKGEGFATVVFEDNTITLNADENSVISNDISPAIAFSHYSTLNGANTTANNNITIKGTINAPYILSGWEADTAMFAADQAYQAQLEAEGYIVDAADETGMVMITGIAPTVYNVGAGQEYATIEDAIAAQKENQADEVIYVLHDDQTITAQSVKYEPDLAQGADKVTVQAAEGTSPRLTLAGVYYGRISAAGAELNMNGITLADARKASGEGKDPDPWEFCYLEFVCDSAVFTGVNFVEGILISGNNTFEGCTFTVEPQYYTELGDSFDYGWDHYALWAANTGTVVVNNCTFNNVGYGAIKSTYGTYGDGTELHLTVTGSTFNNCGWEDNHKILHLEGADSVTVTGNTVNNCYTNWLGQEDEANALVNDKSGKAAVTVANNVINDPDVVATITDAAGTVSKYTDLNKALNDAVTMGGDVIVDLTANVDLTGKEWTPVAFDSYNGSNSNSITVNGNDRKITGLSDMLFGSVWTGTKLEINDLTIADSAIVHDADDATGTVGVGAFVGYVDSIKTLTLNNCHLTGSTVSGGHWTGGLIGYAAGYSNQNDGPVFTTVTVTGCSVAGSTITGKGSVGGVVGHATGSAWTLFNIGDKATTGATLTGNTITSTGTAANKAGVVMGTIGAAGQEESGMTGGVSVNVIESGNTAVSAGTSITTVYGRQGTDTGVLTITGGNYANCPINEADAFAKPLDGYVIGRNEDGSWGLQEESGLFDIAGANIKLGNSLDMSFYVNKADLTGTEYYAVITRTYADGRADEKITIPYEMWEDYNSSLVRFTYTGIAAKEMTDDLYVTVYNSENVAVSNEWVDSIKDYAMRIFKNNDSLTRTVIVDMLNYGAAAQKYFDSYNIAELANAELTAEQQAYATANVAYKNNQVEGKNFAGTSISLKSNILLTMYFNNITTDMTAKITFVDHYGNDESIEIAGTEFVARGSMYGVDIAAMSVADGSQMVTCEIYDGGSLVASASDSIESYIARMSSQAPIYEQVMKFVTSAYNNFH